MKSKKMRLAVLLLAAGLNWSLCGTNSPWICTNATHPRLRETKGPDEYDLTPSIAAEVTNSTAYYNSSCRIFLRKREGLVILVHGSATYGGRIVSDYDIRALGSLDTAGLTDLEVFERAGPSQALLKAGYFRGRLYTHESRNFAEGWITVFASGEANRIVAVTDDGILRFSENSGLAWTDVGSAGVYEFTLATTTNGSSIVAVISLAENSLVGKPKEQTRSGRDWYAVASAADGRKLVLASKPGESLPALSITKSGGSIVLSWPAAVTGVLLQQTSDLETGSWSSLTNVFRQIDGRHQVTLPAEREKNFFRLKRI